MMRLLILSLTGLLLLNTVGFAKSADPQENYEQGITLYREGNYAKALEAFKTSVAVMPESQDAHYYYAITLAQLGRFEDARKAYQTVITLAPNTESAQLAQQGLTYLPDPKALDAPPKFTQPQPQAANTPTPAAAAPTAGGMDPKMLQMMMMMGSMGGGSGGGFNPMMLPMMEQMGKGQGGATGGSDPDTSIAPDTFSTMMMNQMMQNMDFFGKSGKDD